MKIINALGLILILVLSACSVQQQSQPETVTTPQTAAEEPQPETQETVQEETETGETEVAEEEQEEAVEEAVAAGGDVRILGKEGFEPDELGVSAGSSVTWVNGVDKKLTLTFFKDGKFYQNSDIMNSGQKFELTLNEEGSYEYWSPSYGVKGKITVE